jgi:hypothetical protein
MIRVLFTIFLLTASWSSALSQASNDWINFTQTYYRIPVARDGIYKLSYSQLQQAGFPVESADPKLIQLFHRGKEQAIYIEGENDSQFGISDFLQFYGKKNDGTLDSSLYKPTTAQPHKYYNLYSDTTSYFLTVGFENGKRMSVYSEVNDGLSADLYHMDENLMLQTNRYSAGESINDEIFESTFGSGEGWTSDDIFEGGTKDFLFTGVSNTYLAGGSPVIELLIVGRKPVMRSMEIYVGASARLLTSINFSGYDKVLIQENLDWSDFTSDGKLNIKVKLLNVGSVDRACVSYLKIKYPQALNADNLPEKVFQTIPIASEKGFVEIQNPPLNSRLFDITDHNNVGIVEGVSGVAFSAVYSNNNTSRKFFLSNLNLAPAKIVRTTFRKIIPENHDYIIISHPRLRKPASDYSDPVKAYADYRASNEGGSYDTLLLNIDDIYNQFNYGEASPLGIYKLLEFLSASRPPSYLFIIGKGLELTEKSKRVSGTSSWDYQDLIPSGGYPDSDMIYSVGLSASTYAPVISTGRISAMTAGHVAAYLDKIKELEAQPYDQLWRKKILHLSGGIEEGEPEYFQSVLQSYANIAQGPYLGGEVKAIAKKSKDLEVINISEEVNNGLALVTFFGHSSATTLDFDIGFVSDPVLRYNNKGKYPVLLMNGCEAGAAFLKTTLFGENWILTPDKGASAFIAHNSFGRSNKLEVYSRTFYTVGFADSAFIHKGIGDIHRETAKRYIEQSIPSFVNLSQIQQMILLGDPAVKLFGTNKPDLEVKESQLSISPFNESKVSALSDSFAIKIIVRNFGIATSELFRLVVERTLADNSTITYDSLYSIPQFSDTLLFIIRNGNEIIAGNNTFKITLDADDIISEISESNNIASLTYAIPSNGTRNLYPTDFAIVSEQNLGLAFQATDLYSKQRDFLLEIDTLDSFDSGFKKQFTVSGKVLASLAVELVDQDTLAYYWRTRLKDPLPGEYDDWELSSFTFIKNSTGGWAQVHFPQLLKDPTVGLVKNEDLRRIEFENSVTPVDIITFGASAGKPRDSVSVKIKGAEYNLYSMVGGAWGCRMNTINLIAFDRRSTSPYIGIFLKWYEIPGDQRLSCGREPFVINSFTSTEVSNGGSRDIIQYVNNIEEGDSVVLFNIGNPLVSQWPSDAKEKLGEFGISVAQLDQIIPGEPIVIFGKKGSAPGTAKIFRSDSATPALAKLTVNKSISGGYVSGNLTTTLIGPASQWISVISKGNKVDSDDQFSFDVSGVKLNGEEQLLIQDASDSEDLSFISSTTYPYLRIRFHTADSTLLTPAQLKKWIVLYTPVPEGILLPDQQNEPVTVQEGEIWERSFRFVNISDKHFADSLFVRYNVYNDEMADGNNFDFKIKPPAPEDTTHFTVQYDTRGHTGLNDIQLFINPRMQPEQHFDNNILQLNDYLNVVADKLKPLIDVTFDGRHLMNGDYVSKDPLIRIEVWDENALIKKIDTTGVHIYLTYPCTEGLCDTKRISFSSSSIQWYPAIEKTGFLVLFSPENLEPGQYVLSAEAVDGKGNVADPYTISFLVTDERRLEILSLHPNPFYSSAYFGFTITAGSLPEKMTFQVFDLTGKPVFDQDFTIEQFHIGKNMLAWDGRDKKGNLVKSGLYFYMITLYEGENRLIHNGKFILTR